MSEEQKLKWKQRAPFLTVTLLALLTTYFLFWGWVKIISMLVSNYKSVEVYYLPFLFGKAEGVHLLWLPLVTVVSILGWLLSTRVKEYKTPRMRVFMFFNMVFAISGIQIGYGMTKVQEHILPFFYERLNRVIETSDAVSDALFEQIQGFFFLLMMLPLLLMMFVGMFIITRYRQHDKDLRKAFFEFQWSGERLRKFEEMGKKQDTVVSLPDIELGINKKTKEMVVLPGNDRTLNTVITGSIGTGKSAALGLPIINQDLHFLTRFINDYSKISKMENFLSQQVLGRYLNGITVIEPSNDLCQKVYKLAKAHGIPDEAITYIDPTNPKTPSINVMQGPTEKVAEVFAEVIAGLSTDKSGGSFFFQQAQRNHLKHHIYLLKMHNPKIDVTFDMLLDMYNDANRVHDMHLQLKKRFPENYELIEDRDEYNYWQILKGIDEWFDKVIVPKEERIGGGTQLVRDDNGKIVYMDAQEEYVQGLRNILNDIGANPLIRRVLFGKSKFNFDDHMGSVGGILLVNTAKGELEKLGSVLGKIVLMTLQNASFRRKPYISTYHHILIDEAPEYLYSSFASFPAQSRKYKVILTILQQTLTQLKGAFGEDYMNTVVAAMRNRMVYADVSSYDANYFSGMFGEKDTYQEGESEQSISPLQENPVTRSGSNFSKTREAALTAGEIIFQDAYECAVKIVVDNKTIPVQQIKANFIPDEEFEKAVIQVEREAVLDWLNARYHHEVFHINDEGEHYEEVKDIQVESPILPPKEIVKQEVAVTVESSNLQENTSPSEVIDPMEIEEALKVTTRTKPIDEDVNYQKNRPTAYSLADVTVPHSMIKEKSKVDEPSTSKRVEEKKTAPVSENAEMLSDSENVPSLLKITIPNAITTSKTSDSAQEESATNVEQKMEQLQVIETENAVEIQVVSLVKEDSVKQESQPTTNVSKQMKSFKAFTVTEAEEESNKQYSRDVISDTKVEGFFKDLQSLSDERNQE